MNGVDTQILWDYHVVHPLGVILDPQLGPLSARPYGPWAPSCAPQGSVPGAPPAAVDRRLVQLHSPGRTSTLPCASEETVVMLPACLVPGSFTVTCRRRLPAAVALPRCSGRSKCVRGWGRSWAGAANRPWRSLPVRTEGKWGLPVSLAARASATTLTYHRAVSL